jgi:cytoskeletal protein CcmA (bactofilin family)
MLGRGAREPNSDETRSPLDPERRVAAWIGASIVIQGQLTSSEDLTIAGRVKGDVEVRDNVLVIAPGAHIEGNVVALTVVVNGRVTGDIEAKGSVEIGSSGSVAGDIATPRMTIAEGAMLTGQLSVAVAAQAGAR